METSWYLLHIDPPPPSDKEEERVAEQEAKAEEEKEEIDVEKAQNDSARERADKEAETMLSVPQVGTPILHFAPVDEDRGAKEKQQENVLWEMIQDDNRPAWAPDLLRLGYAVVFKREGLPKLAVKLGIRNPAKVTVEERRRSRDRILTFNDVWVMGVVPHRMPFYFPDKDLEPEEWWLATREANSSWAPYLAPQGATVATGAQRLSDVVIQMLRTPQGFPRKVPGQEDDDFGEFINPLVPLLPKSPAETSRPPRSTNYGNSYGPETGYGFAGLELFRYGTY